VSNAILAIFEYLDVSQS